MPHITISAVPGHSTEEKARLAEKITELTAAEFHVPQDIVSVSMQEISKSEWRAFMKQFPKEELLIIPPYPRIQNRCRLVSLTLRGFLQGM